MTGPGPPADGRRHDVLIANARVDEAWAAWAADVLRDAGRSVALLQDGLRDFLDLRQVIERELGSAGQVVALLSKAAPTFLAAVISVANGLGTRVVPVHVEDGSAQYPRELAHLRALDLTDVSVDVAEQRLLAALDGSFDHRVRANFVRRRPPAPDPFVGREGDLGWLSTAFLAGRPAVVVSGPAGVGKSALAAQFIRRNRTLWTDVLWSSPARFAEDQLKVLTRPRGPSLLVIDGADDYRAVRDALWPVLLDRDLVHVLVTSTAPGWPAPFRELRLGPLDGESAARLVRARVPGGAGLAPVIGTNPAAVEALSLLVADFPSVDELAADLSWVKDIASALGAEEHGFYYLGTADPAAVGAFERAFVGLGGDVELLSAGKGPWRRWWRHHCRPRPHDDAGALVRLLAATQPISRVVVNVGSSVFVKTADGPGPRTVSRTLSATQLRRFEHSQRLRQDPIPEVLGGNGARA